MGHKSTTVGTPAVGSVRGPSAAKKLRAFPAAPPGPSRRRRAPDQDRTGRRRARDRVDAPPSQPAHAAPRPRRRPAPGQHLVALRPPRPRLGTGPPRRLDNRHPGRRWLAQRRDGPALRRGRRRRGRCHGPLHVSPVGPAARCRWPWTLTAPAGTISRGMCVSTSGGSVAHNVGIGRQVHQQRQGDSCWTRSTANCSTLLRFRLA